MAAKRTTKKPNVDGMLLLGEIITWNARTDSTHTHSNVIEALKSADLDEDVCRELLPRHAFARACRKMKDNRMIDPVNETEDIIVFQLTRKFLADEELKFEKEILLRLNKTSGQIVCQNAKLQELAQAKLDEAMDVRTTNDITKIVQRLFEANADLFPVRNQGGVYFVPSEHRLFIERIQKFLETLGGHVNRFPVPMGTEQGDRAVQNSVADAMSQLITDHTLAVEAFSLNTRADTIAAAAEKIKATRVKIEAYANYLQDKSKGLLEEVDAANAKLTQQIENLTVERAAMPAASKDSKLVFGHTLTAVIRWMGKQAWTYEQASTALTKLNISVADATIRCQLTAGKKGTRGEPATLTEKQIKTLTTASKPTKGKTDDKTKTTEQTSVS